MGNDSAVDYLRPEDEIYILCWPCPPLPICYAHFGIYDGDGGVIHSHKLPGGWREVRRVSLEEFAAGRRVHVRR
jgi:hypothetical protein